MNTDTPAPSALPADSSKQYSAEANKAAQLEGGGATSLPKPVIDAQTLNAYRGGQPPSPDKSAGGTARTDRFFTDLTDTGGAWGTKDAHKLADFARTLERELAQAQQSLAEANNQLGRAHEEYRNINHAYQQLSDDHRKRITDFLNEYQCCGGFECGCGGITRLQFLIEEQAGTQLDATRAQLKDLTDQFSALRARDNIGMSPGERIMEEIRTKAFDQSAYIKKCERLLRIAGNNANDSDEGIESFELRILELLKNSPIK